MSEGDEHAPSRLEERFLDAEHGGYDEYHRRRVPMLVPFAPR